MLFAALADSHSPLPLPDNKAAQCTLLPPEARRLKEHRVMGRRFAWGASAINLARH